MSKNSCKMNKNFLRYSMYFHRWPTSSSNSPGRVNDFFYWWEIGTKIHTYMDKFIDQLAIALWFTGRGSKKVLWAASWNPRVTSLETFPDYVPWNSIFFLLVILRLYYNLHFNIKSFASLTSLLTFLDGQLVHK